MQKRSKPFFFLTDVQKGQEQSVPVVLPHTPQELYEIFDFDLPEYGVGAKGNTKRF